MNEAGGFGGEGVGPITAAGVAAGAGGAPSAAARTPRWRTSRSPTPPLWRKATSPSPRDVGVGLRRVRRGGVFADLLADAAEFGDGATVPRG
ncbi:hypothetical protein MMPV_008619 [Pyropia vietnamensis]